MNTDKKYMMKLYLSLAFPHYDGKSIKPGESIKYCWNTLGNDAVSTFDEGFVGSTTT